MEKLPVCEYLHVHEDIVKEALEELPSDDELNSMVDFYKVLGDKTRIKILFCLLKHEMCVCDIAKATNMSQSNISHQLRILKNLKIVKYRKEKKSVFYSLDDDHIHSILDQGLVHIHE